MADGIVCKHCGWQETNHTYGAEGIDESPDVPFKGYKSSLKDCPGYEPEDPELADRLARIAEEEKTRQSRNPNPFGGCNDD